MGASWSLLELLGAILGRLGAKLCGLGATFGALDFVYYFFEQFWEQTECPKEAFGEPKRSKNLSKKRYKSNSEKVTSWSRLGAILGRFPRRQGVKNVFFF